MAESSAAVDTSRATSSAEPRVVHSAARHFGPKSVLDDLAEGLARQAVWRTFAWDEIQQRYNRSIFGVAWIAGSFGVFVAAIAIFFGGFAALETGDFVSYVAIGFAGFSFLTANLTDGCAVFRAAAGWIVSSPLPYSIYVYKSIARSAFTFALQLACALAILLVAFGWRPDLMSLLAIPAVAIFVLNAIWVQYLLGLFAARYGDVEHIVGTLQRVLFFTTPIMWVYEERGGFVRTLADLNPLTHFIEILRAPLLGALPSMASLIFVGCTTVGGWVLMLLIAGRMRRRLPFWV